MAFRFNPCNPCCSKQYLYPRHFVFNPFWISGVNPDSRTFFKRLSGSPYEIHAVDNLLDMIGETREEAFGTALVKGVDSEIVLDTNDLWSGSTGLQHTEYAKPLLSFFFLHVFHNLYPTPSNQEYFNVHEGNYTQWITLTNPFRIFYEGVYQYQVSSSQLSRDRNAIMSSFRLGKSELQKIKEEYKQKVYDFLEASVSLTADRMQASLFHQDFVNDPFVRELIGFFIYNQPSMSGIPGGPHHLGQCTYYNQFFNHQDLFICENMSDTNFRPIHNTEDTVTGDIEYGDYQIKHSRFPFFLSYISDGIDLSSGVFEYDGPTSTGGYTLEKYKSLLAASFATKTMYNKSIFIPKGIRVKLYSKPYSFSVRLGIEDTTHDVEVPEIVVLDDVGPKIINWYNKNEDGGFLRSFDNFGGPFGGRDNIVLHNFEDSLELSGYQPFSFDDYLESGSLIRKMFGGVQSEIRERPRHQESVLFEDGKERLVLFYPLSTYRSWKGEHPWWENKGGEIHLEIEQVDSYPT